jgi:hypothetical protein
MDANELKNLAPLTLPDHTQVRQARKSGGAVPVRAVGIISPAGQPNPVAKNEPQTEDPRWDIEEEKKILMEIYSYLDSIERKWKSIQHPEGNA